MKGQRNRTSSFTKFPPVTCSVCGRKIMVDKMISANYKGNSGYKIILRVKIDNSKGNGRSSAKSLRELEKTSIPV